MDLSGSSGWRLTIGGGWLATQASLLHPGFSSFTLFIMCKLLFLFHLTFTYSHTAHHGTSCYCMQAGHAAGGPWVQSSICTLIASGYLRPL